MWETIKEMVAHPMHAGKFQWRAQADLDEGGQRLWGKLRGGLWWEHVEVIEKERRKKRKRKKRENKTPLFA